MRTEVWVHGAVFALAIAQFFIFWYLYRRSELSSTHEMGQHGTLGASDSNPGTDDHHVACPNCGTLNTSRFQYCRNCVEELPRSSHTG